MALAGLSVHRAAVTVAAACTLTGTSNPRFPDLRPIGTPLRVPGRIGNGGIPCFKPELPNPAESGNG